MDTFLPLLLLLLAMILLIAFKIFAATPGGRTKNLHETSSKLPPGPPQLPIVGNLFELGNKPHESITKLSKLYGPLITLKLGSVTTIIASSPSMAKQILQTNDHILATSRDIPDAVRSLNYHQASMVWLPPKKAWRSLRMLCSSEIFTINRLNASQGTREQKIHQLLDYIESKCCLGESVDIGQAAFATVLNLISYTSFSVDLADIRSESMREFKMVVRGTTNELGKPNVSDFFPVLKLFDLQGVRRRTTTYFRKLDEIFDGFITARLELPREFSQSDRDLLDALLCHSNEDGSKLSSHAIKALLKDIFIAGSGTTSITVEWAMAELLKNPQTMAKVKAELKERIEEGKKLIQESDIPKLPYLQAIVKETLRLHPPGPFLLPRKAEVDVELCGGFRVPKNAKVLVNLWAIGRDAEIWKNPTKFDPERFLGSDIGFKGRDFELMPFGAGRRICPGLPLADRMVHLMLASLVHCFDWKLEGGMRAGDLNMEEKFGLTLPKAHPLLAVPIRSTPIGAQ